MPLVNVAGPLVQVTWKVLAAVVISFAADFVPAQKAPAEKPIGDVPPVTVNRTSIVLFAPPETFDLEKIVFNTEAHALRRTR